MRRAARVSTNGQKAEASCDAMPDACSSGAAAQLWIAPPFRSCIALSVAAGLLTICGCMADADNPQVKFERGNLLADRDQFEDAIPLYTMALEALPDRADIYFERGLCFENLGLEDKALADYEACLQLDPQFSDALNNKGVILAKTAKYADAVDVFSSLITQFPDDSLALRNRGLSYFDLGEFDKALADYDLVLQRTPDDAETWFQRGNVFLELKEFEKAIADYSSAIEVDPGFARAWMNRGVAKFGTDDRSGGMEDLQHAHFLDENIVVPDLDWGRKVLEPATTVITAKPVVANEEAGSWKSGISAAIDSLSDRGFSNVSTEISIPELRCALLTATQNDGAEETLTEIYLATREKDGPELVVPALSGNKQIARMLMIVDLSGDRPTVVEFVDNWNGPGNDATPVAVRMSLNPNSDATE